MLAPMGWRSVGIRLGSYAVLLASCGGHTTIGSDDFDGGTAGGAGSGGTGGTRFDGGIPLPATGGNTYDASDFEDPGCPDAEPPEPYFECDPLASVSGCASGYACYPVVYHPVDGSGCGQQQYGAVCMVPGAGTGGDPCGDGYGICAAGHICVVGSKPGKRCAKICPLVGEHNCPLGLICGETDIEGIGVCS
jgi:hypothetical protein